MLHHRHHKHSLLHHHHMHMMHHHKSPVDLKEEVEELSLPAEQEMKHGGMAHHHHHNPKASFPQAIEAKLNARRKFQI